jgi:outer membrane immunogenic protein
MEGRMRKILGLVGATLLFAGPALAADLGKPPVYKAPPPLPIFSWTGFYLGAHGGYGWSNSQGLDLKGGFGGGQIGYNYQINNFVFGIEGDGAGGDISQTVNDIVIGVPFSGTFSFNALASLRGRLGVTYNNVLFYGTGGAGWGHGKLSVDVPGLTVSDSQWHTGWTAGAGIEYAFQPNWSAKVEYLHYGFDSASYTFPVGTFASGNVDVDTIKVGINYLFH